MDVKRLLHLVKKRTGKDFVLRRLLYVTGNDPLGHFGQIHNQQSSVILKLFHEALNACLVFQVLELFSQSRRAVIKSDLRQFPVDRHILNALFQTGPQVSHAHRIRDYAFPDSRTFSWLRVKTLITRTVVQTLVTLFPPSLLTFTFGARLFNTAVLLIATYVITLAARQDRAYTRISAVAPPCAIKQTGARSRRMRLDFSSRQSIEAIGTTIALLRPLD